ncbi:ferritin-like domain-containing protein [Diaphorobacter sp. ED-3]|uniref:ferritin-like domain-containing protein n=1 Tax=unclassified Diaphorobacter TaxID=2649760 RepID=UPI00205F1EE6|nr:ferritin-like domain-containing protein [Diaphorobacter sp. ED-3]UOB06729.1 ferritin-like domain-containing protein [Diaphorobacter sp. LI3]
MELRQRALEVLRLCDPEEKSAAALDMYTQAARISIATEMRLTAPPADTLPGRPARPQLLHHTAVARRSPATPEGRAVLIHAIAHIEFNAINLALDAIWRFAGMPETFYRDWLRVAAEEAKHFRLLRDHLRRQLHHDYGDFPAHQGLWGMCEKTADDIVARMALVPRTLEARGLDATPLIQHKLRQVGTPDALAAVAILDTILREEVGHVAIGNHWYGWLCTRAGLDPVAHYAALVQRYEAPRPKPPLNEAARRAAGFSEAEMRWLQHG